MPGIQDEINEKTIAIVVKGGKISSRLLAKTLSLLFKLGGKGLKAANEQSYKGKQTLKKLSSHGVGISSIEITDENIKSFDSVAKKYGIDYSLKRVDETPPKHLVFFKGRDVDVMNMAFKEYVKNHVNKKEKPSLLARIKENIEKIKEQTIDKVKVKDKGLEL